MYVHIRTAFTGFEQPIRGSRPGPMHAFRQDRPFVGLLHWVRTTNAPSSPPIESWFSLRQPNGSDETVIEM